MLLSATTIFFLFLFVYLFIASIICFFINKNFESLTPFKSFFLAGIIGITGYFVANFIGFNFNDSNSKIQLFVDLIWQFVEQGIGGLITYYLLKIGSNPV